MAEICELRAGTTPDRMVQCLKTTKTAKNAKKKPIQLAFLKAIFSPP
jgi:hypothetical protein